MEPGKIYGYAGKVCYCPPNPPTQWQRPMNKDRGNQRMTNNILKYLEGLEERERNSTPGPWSIYGATGEGTWIAQHRVLPNGYYELVDYAYAYDRKRHDNALLIIIQRNEFPKLLSAMREMIEALNDIGNHWCGYSAEHVSEDWKILLEQVYENRKHACSALQKVEQILCETNKGEK